MPCSRVRHTGGVESGAAPSPRTLPLPKVTASPQTSGCKAAAWPLLPGFLMEEPYGTHRRSARFTGSEQVFEPWWASVSDAVLRCHSPQAAGGDQGCVPRKLD